MVMSTTLCQISISLVAFLVAHCACASLGATSGASGPGQTSRFGQFSLSPAQYQSWQEWARKRNIGGSNGQAPWGKGLFATNNFQDWREFMSKRGFNIPDSAMMRPWIKRQGLGNNEGNPFPTQDNFGNYGHFQKWGDWFNKRGSGMSPFNHGPALFGTGAGSDMQSWEEFMKRKGFGFSSPSQFGLGPHQQGLAGLQNWHEWAKRMGPLTTSDGHWGSFGKTDFGSWGDKEQLMDWESEFKNKAEKRQLGYTPHSFGSFNRYFTDGLQDWRSTFKGSKRGAQDSEAASASARDGSEKQETQ